MLLDDALRAEYARFGIAADSLVVDTALSKQFLAAVARDVGEPVEAETALKRLLTLRKRGRKNGGLPPIKPR